MNDSKMIIDNHYAALALIDVLYKEGLINKETYNNIMAHEDAKTDKPIWASDTDNK